MNDKKEVSHDVFDLANGVESKTGEHLAIRVEEPIGRIAACLLDETGMGPLPNLAYELWLDDELVISGETDDEGIVSHEDMVDDYYVLKTCDTEYCIGTISEDDEPVHICIVGQDSDKNYDVYPELDGEPDRNLS